MGIVITFTSNNQLSLKPFVFIIFYLYIYSIEYLRIHIYIYICIYIYMYVYTVYTDEWIYVLMILIHVINIIYTHVGVHLQLLSLHCFRAKMPSHFHIARRVDINFLTLCRDTASSSMIYCNACDKLLVTGLNYTLFIHKHDECPNFFGLSHICMFV